MPYVDLYSEDDYASIYYYTNSPFGNVGGFDELKPTILMLHPYFLDLSWLESQFGDPRLHDHYNIVAFDLRLSGRSTTRPTGRHDSWVDAADIAKCAMKLRLPKSHVLAHDSVSVNTALRLTYLFPEVVASLTLCNVPPQMELRWVFEASEEMVEQWCFPPDLETLEMAGKESLRFLVGPDCDMDLQDEILAYWQIQYPPRRRQRTLELCNLAIHRQPMTADMLKEITCSVLILHGDRNDLSPTKHAEDLRARLVNVRNGGAVLYTVRGASGSLSAFSGNASIVTQVFSKFLKQQPRIPSTPLPEYNIPDRMSEALHKLSEAHEAKDMLISTRDPMSSLSFCILPLDVLQKQEEQMIAYGQGMATAFSPLTANGRPTRKYSDRKDEHWFSSGQDGLSYASPFRQSKQKLESVERPLPLPRSEPMTDVAHHGRSRRGTIGPNSVEKGVIKGSMAKVVSTNSSTSSMGRLLK